MPRHHFLIEPHPQQVVFMNCDQKEQLFGGAKRGGKSVALCQKMIALSMAFPGNRGILIRQNLTDLKDSTLVTFFTVCPPELIANHHLNDRKITFVNGSYFVYRGVGDAHEVEKVKGVDIGWLATDEPSEIELETYLMLLAQLNWRLPKPVNGSRRPPYMALLACNPEPGWVKKRFIDPGDKLPEDRVFIPSYAKDNPGLPEGYVAELRRNFPEEWVKKYVDGSWEISEGMVFQEFDRKTHVVSQLPNFASMLHYGGMDHGTTGITTFYNYGQLATSDAFTTKEYYEANKLVSQHAIYMRDRIAWYAANGYQYEYTIADPAINQKSSQGNQQLQSVQTLYEEEGIPLIPGWNLMEAGIERLKQMLHVNPLHPHPLTGKLGAPYFYIHESCVHLIDEFQGWKKKVDANGYVTYTGPDHGLDPTRYFVNSRPRVPVYSDPSTPADRAVEQGDIRYRAARSHDRWKSRFDKQVRKAQTGGQGHFDYLGRNQ